MSEKYIVEVCEMNEHELEDNSQPDFLGDGSSIIVLNGTCQKCGFDVSKRIDGFSVCYTVSVNGIEVMKRDSCEHYTKMLDVLSDYDDDEPSDYDEQIESVY